MNDNGTVTMLTDYCRSFTSTNTKYKGYIIEYYCNDTAIASSNYKCPKGCLNGACV